MAHRAPIAQAAIALKLLRAYVSNEPVSRQKAACVQRGVIALAVSMMPAAALFLTGGVR
jgi:hypothetical protein